MEAQKPSLPTLQSTLPPPAMDSKPDKKFRLKVEFSIYRKFLSIQCPPLAGELKGVVLFKPLNKLTDLIKNNINMIQYIPIIKTQNAKTYIF